MFDDLTFLNPKKNKTNSVGFYDYYAGFSSKFVSSIIESINTGEQISVLDPWNGSGTTTRCAYELGHNAIGIDLNPVMVITSKANLLCHTEYPSIIPLSKDIINKSINYKNTKPSSKDLLNIWFTISTVERFRKIEQAIQQLFINTNDYDILFNYNQYDKISSLCSFFYVALFKTVRDFLNNFKTTNPTWIKKPKSDKEKIDVPINYIVDSFYSNINNMLELANSHTTIKTTNLNNTSKILLGSSTDIPLEKESVDLILSSPPYCTRIDYAVATMPELAIIGYTEETFKEIRKRLIGTSTVSREDLKRYEQIGINGNIFLDDLYNHYTKASKTYYYKNHIQYFNSICKSLLSIYDVLKVNGTCILVVQDSYYKDLHNDLPKHFVEIANNCGLSLSNKVDFSTVRNMVGINPKVNKYNRTKMTVESVLCFTKN
jgi:DNA modification methylase